MMASKKTIKILYYQKYLGLFLIGIGIPVFFLDSTNGSEMPLMVGLFTLFVSSEKIEDERTISLKTTSLYIAFIVCYAIKLVTTNLFSHHIISWQLVEINHFIILVFAFSILIYYFRLYVMK